MKNETTRRLFSGGIVAAGLLGLALLAVVGVVLVVGHSPTGEERSLLGWVFIATAIAVLLAPVTSRRLRAFAKRLIYRDRRDSDAGVRNFAGHASRSVPLDELLLQATESLRASFALASAEIWVVAGNKLVLKVSDPEHPRPPIPLGTAETGSVARAGVSGPAWLKIWLPQFLVDRGEDPILRAAPVSHSGELLGMIVVQRPAGAAVFTEEEERTITELARQIGLTLHNAKLDSALQASLDEVRRQAAELQASRGRIVVAGDTARRQIERNLHDGAQQHLVALAVKVRLIKQLTNKDPAKVAELLDQLGGDLDDTLQELRDLAHGIYPPLLADKGLPEALASAARRASLETTVDAAGVHRYAPEVESTAYFCCLEAMQNAGKYAGEAARVTIRAAEDGGALVFSVADNGAGFDTRGAAMGAGFTNMNDRLGAVGGTLRVESTPGKGTKITGVIPLPAGGDGTPETMVATGARESGQSG